MARARAKKRDDVGDQTESEKRAASGYWTGAHTTHRLRFHLTFIPKYRKRVLEGAVARRVQELFEEACNVMEWELHELSVQPVKTA